MAIWIPILVGALLNPVAARQTKVDLAGSEPSRPVAASKERPLPRGDALAITVSGGASLGSYEAGFVYASLEMFKHLGRARRIRVTTGASAGSANALIAALNSCTPAQPDPTADLGWKMWIPIGFDALFDPQKVTSQGVFHRDAMVQAFGAIESLLEQGLPRDCDVVVGVSVTRIAPHRVDAAAGLSIVRQEEKFAVRFRGHGSGQPVELSNYWPERLGAEHAMLPFRAYTPGRNTLLYNFGLVKRLLFASSAFPFAFAPVEVPHCLARDPHATCLEPSRTDPFIDGGVFDNTPLRLANQLVRGGLGWNTGGVPAWRDAVPSLRPERPLNTAYLFLDVATKQYPTQLKSDRETEDPLTFVVDTVGNLIATARSKELYTVLQEDPRVASWMRPVPGFFPAAGEPMFAFLGFFERDFREYDFFLGMAEAYLHAKRAGILDAKLRDLREGPWQRAPTWEPLACILSAIDGDASHLRPYCGGDERNNLRVLLQISLDRFYDVCLRVAQNAATLEQHPHCAVVNHRSTPPEVISPLPPFASRRRLPGESDLRYQVRLLQMMGFQFKDLKAGGDPAMALRRKVVQVSTAFAKAQDDATVALAITTLGRQLGNALAFEPAPHWFYANAGSTIEAGAVFRISPRFPEWLRFNAAAHLKGLLSPVTQGDLILGTSLLVGPEFQVISLGSEFAYPFIGLRGGYQISNLDRLGSNPCQEQTDGGRDVDGRRCTQPIFQAYLGGIFAERLRLQLAFEYLPQVPEWEERTVDVHFGVGVQFY